MKELRKDNMSHCWYNYYIENFYLDGTKKGVYSTNCNIFINQQFFSFDEKYLIINLSQNINEKEPFKLIKLFGDDIIDVRLVKYHRSKSCAIFFFIYNTRYNNTTPKTKQ